MIDRITGWTPGRSISGVKAVSFEEYQLKEAFGGEPELPVTLMLESFIQLGNWLVLLTSNYQKMGLVVETGPVCIQRPLRPGQKMQIELVLVEETECTCVLSGDGRVQGQPVIVGFRFTLTLVPAVEFVDPDALRVLYTEINTPCVPRVPTHT